MRLSSRGSEIDIGDRKHCRAQGRFDRNLEQVVNKLWGHFRRRSPHSQPIKDVFGPPLKAPPAMFPRGARREGSLVDGPVSTIRRKAFRSCLLYTSDAADDEDD